MAGYVYKGTDFDAHLPVPGYEPKPPTRVVKCGTRSGYVGHIKRKESACPPCAEANLKYNREYAIRRANRAINTGFNSAKCGTIAGYSAHRYHAVPMCDSCFKVHSDYQKARKAAKKAGAA